MNTFDPPLDRSKMSRVRLFFCIWLRLFAIAATVLFLATLVPVAIFDGFFGLFGLPTPDQTVLILNRNYQSLLIYLFGGMSVLWLIYHIIMDDIQMIFGFMALLVTVLVMQIFHQ